MKPFLHGQRHGMVRMNWKFCVCTFVHMAPHVGVVWSCMTHCQGYEDEVESSIEHEPAYFEHDRDTVYA